MPTSGSVDFKLTLNALVSEILEQLAIIPPGGIVRAEDYTSCVRTLNLMIKAWQMSGIFLWTEVEGYLFLNADQTSYQLGGSSGADRAVTAYVATTLSADEALGQTTLSVTSSSGILASDIVGIELSDGTMQWSTVSSVPDSTSIIINDALTDDASDGAAVFTYDPADVITRPLEVTSMRIRKDPTSDIRIYPISKSVYQDLPNKTSTAQPIQYYVDKQRDYTRVSFYPTPNSVSPVVHFSYKRIIEDLDGSTNDLDFPQEATLALVYNGCVHLAPKYGKSQNISEMVSGSPSIAALAQYYYRLLENNNQEQARLRIRPWVPE